ncbi:thiamine/thiamine pyrophosphate ABC transporter permease ThiP [Caviibacterium pharyngocola]|uniref:Thiamine transport system permease protein ThiP n=1 Tax=Caviibacterium pharyngocola TaxID=28159 RepID=A0A2M8RWZ5_9PAST|nr:thiamine/thiamine pyrophosphate ABC transporter permease ThiP [Caviibacterium pharyngocola]PJG83418.1 thiamine/thiamine pyrophosphate ABC transporter permease ThiP [Caviibacterium pharyngocola]
MANVLFRPKYYLAGSSVIALIALFYFIALNAVFSVGGEYDLSAFWQDRYIHRVIGFSIEQALLSALLSVIFGFLFARAFFYQAFPCKRKILKLLSLTFVLPALVAVFGLISVYGNSGWTTKLTALLGIEGQNNFYGLTGILTAHLFFNIPLAAKMFLQCLQSIPNQQRQLAAQLNIRGWRFIRLIELPYIRAQLLPVFALIFMLCFTGFTIVLTLGGGPQYTTLEVAIYQAVVFEFDLPKAALLAVLQFVFCLLLFSVMSALSKTPNTQLNGKNLWRDKQSGAVKIWQVFYLSATLLFLITPLCGIIVNAFSSENILTAWQNPQLWRALGYSLTIAPASAFVALCAALALLSFSRRLQWQGFPNAANGVISAGMIILAIPTLVLAIGLFIVLQSIEFNRLHLFIIVVLCNALAAMPFVLRVLVVPMNNNMQYYEKLCQSLGITGWARWRLIERHSLRELLQYAFALACALSLGDFTAIALFGNQDFTSLPHLLYQQLGTYRTADAAVTALILLSVCTLLFIWVDNRHNDRT